MFAFSFSHFIGSKDKSCFLLNEYSRHSKNAWFSLARMHEEKYEGKPSTDTVSLFISLYCKCRLPLLSFILIIKWERFGCNAIENNGNAAQSNRISLVIHTDKASAYASTQISVFNAAHLQVACWIFALVIIWSGIECICIQHNGFVQVWIYRELPCSFIEGIVSIISEWIQFPRQTEASPDKFGEIN